MPDDTWRCFRWFGRLAGACIGLAVTLTSAFGATETKPILTVPPMQWDARMSRFHPGVIQGPTDVANLTGGIVFGLSPGEVDSHMPTPVLGLTWENLPFATEYLSDVRYFWVRFSAAPAPHPRVENCAGSSSYVVFFFRNRRLFRISWRLLADETCASPRAAAEDIYASWLSIDRRTAFVTHYSPNQAEVVEVTDPGANDLIPIRWENRKRR